MNLLRILGNGKDLIPTETQTEISVKIFFEIFFNFWQRKKNQNLLYLKLDT
jgi:hypothetical protein